MTLFDVDKVLPCARNSQSVAQCLVLAALLLLTVAQVARQSGLVAYS
jgi:hypothetical protein